ncbi:MAG: ion transporter [Lachnospiraceae bacterium]|nr:ion transporter [Lachnospiraceae bacterium]
MNLQNWRKVQDKLYKMVSVGVVDDFINQSYDVITTAALIINLAAAFANTFDPLHDRFGNAFAVVEAVTVFVFAVDYVLRLLTARCLYPKVRERRAVLKYISSFSGVIDLLSFLPYYLPFIFPAGAAVFKLFRVVRILRLFRINAYYDSLNVITEILASKKQQLYSSVFIIIVLMMGASLCMYSLENTAQPDVFQNAFSGIWWAASTLLTVGYGDIYPVTFWGKFVGIIITFLGVGMVAIPTGIISDGFVEQ